MQGDLPPPHPSVVCGLEKLERSSRSSSFCGITGVSLPLAHQPAFSSSLISAAEALSRGEEGEEGGRREEKEAPGGRACSHCCEGRCTSKRSRTELTPSVPNVPSNKIQLESISCSTWKGKSHNFTSA